MAMHMLRAKFLLGCVLIAVSVGQAQEKTEFSGSGTISDMRPGLIQMLGDTGPVVIKVDPMAEIHVTGTAEADFLRPGLFVRFKGEFDKKGRPAGPIQELEIVTLGPKVVPGVQSEASAFAAQEPATPAETASYTVIGRLGSFNKAGKFAVAAGNQPVKGELAEGAVIKVDISDYSAAAQGDKIAVKGWSVQEGQVVANQIAIELANPLVGKKSRGRTKLAKPGAFGSGAAAKEPFGGKEPQGAFGEKEATDPFGAEKKDGAAADKDAAPEKDAVPEE